jgi:hypothetical protein
LKIDGVHSREMSNFSYTHTVFAGDVHDTIFNPFLDVKYKIQFYTLKPYWNIIFLQYIQEDNILFSFLKEDS